MDGLKRQKSGERQTGSTDRKDGKRVLLVEDDKNQRRMCCLAFKVKFPEHEVRAVGTAQEALSVAEEFEPEVVLVDFGLPDMPGWELGERLCAHPRLGGAVLISLSGRGEPGDYRKSEDAGFARHMVKPPDLDLLESWFHA